MAVTSARATGRELALVQEIVSAIPLPDAVHGFSLEYGEDSTGDPAIWIDFAIDDDLDPSREKIESLSKLSWTVTRKLFEADISREPYVRFRVPE